MSKKGFKRRNLKSLDIGRISTDLKIIIRKKKKKIKVQKLLIVSDKFRYSRMSIICYTK